MELKVLDEVDRARKQGKGNEDSFVELKRSIPNDPRKAARQIAALCNAAQGEEVLWIIGIDGKTGEVDPGFSDDLQDWWPSVAKCFNEVYPEMSDVVVTVDEDKAVAGLFFTTDRAPYVVNTPGQGFDREVPWREGTTTRSAHRRELMRLLKSTVHAPEVEVLKADLQCSKPALHEGVDIDESWLSMTLNARLFVAVPEPATIPAHQQEVSLVLGEQRVPLEVSFWVGTPEAGVRGNSEVVRLEYPAVVALRAGLGINVGAIKLARKFHGADYVKVEMSLWPSYSIVATPVSFWLASISRREVDTMEPGNLTEFWKVGDWRLHVEVPDLDDLEV